MPLEAVDQCSSHNDGYQFLAATPPQRQPGEQEKVACFKKWAVGRRVME